MALASVQQERTTPRLARFPTNEIVMQGEKALFEKATSETLEWWEKAVTSGTIEARTQKQSREYAYKIQQLKDLVQKSARLSQLECDRLVSILQTTDSLKIQMRGETQSGALEYAQYLLDEMKKLRFLTSLGMR